MAFNDISIPIPNDVTVISLVAWIFYELGNMNTAARIFRTVDDIVIQFGFYSSIILSCFFSDTSCEDVKIFHYTAMYQMKFGIFNYVNLANTSSERQRLIRSNNRAGNVEFNFCSKNSMFCCKALKMKNVSTDAGDV
ncbi:9706_t:CDS:2 [Cetraspora pellucida]|uniref:9706_t:CDS:1 n=1 Tax=Cetraspora pellucida TaxID=1433469 RepID=A0A9N9AIU4_9GLOM|nr:9706_t:CDS:2 [Cetraspora pellucida]